MGTRIFTDMMGNKVALNYPPKRIISLVPSQTELLHDLGLNNEVVGITKFCVHPDEWFRNKKRIGGTKTVNLGIIKSLQPDLIIANKEENTKEQIDALSAIYPTWVSDIRNIEDGIEMISQVGQLTNRIDQANLLLTQINEGFSTFTNRQLGKRVAYFIWRKPWICVGGNTFINSIIDKIGWSNALADKQRYPEVTLDELADKQIDVVLLSSEPYPFKDKHIKEIKESLPNVAVMLVDGEMFSWYGSRMRNAIPYLAFLTKKPN